MRDWRITLVEAHPQLFHAPVGRPALAHGYPNCGDGWRDLLERACERIEIALSEQDTFAARALIQRCGTLRFYWSGNMQVSSQSLVADAICRAEARSHCTCEECGEPGCLYRADEGFMTRCTAHARGRLVPTQPCFENAHLVQQIVDGRMRVVARRYDPTIDAFIELPSALQSRVREAGRCFRDIMRSSGGIAWAGCKHNSWSACRRRGYNLARRRLRDWRAPTLQEH
ncbi:hypothetical protein ACVIHD_006430 [Bradyrhizobium embrapense]